MTPAAFESAIQATDRAFSERYVDLLVRDAGDAKFAKMLISSKNVYLHLLLNYLMENHMFDEKTVILPPQAMK